MLTLKGWKKVFLGGVVSLMVLGTGGASAETAWIGELTVTRTLSDAGVYGNCMAHINKPLREFIVNCPSSWVTFSCSGTYNSKADGQRKFESAQLAFMQGYRVKLLVDNTKKHNGFCYARRIDVYE